MDSQSKKKNILKNIIFCLLMCLVGLAVSLSVKEVYRQKNEKSNEEQIKLVEYRGKIDELNEKIAFLESAIEKNKEAYFAQVTSLANVDSSFYNLLSQYHNNIDSAKEIAGLTEMQGEGITVEIKDSAESEDVYSGKLVVHDSTIMELVNDLRTAGAKAISINGERIIATTEFICVGPAVKVNGTKLFSPFVVKAIGNSESLTEAVKNGSVYANQAVSLSVKIQTESKLTIEGYNKPYKNSIELMRDYKGE